MSQNVLILTVELIGTLAFTVSGAMVGIRKKMDIFGISILGLCPAVGGGILRDLLLGNTPPAAFRDPVYALVSIGVSNIVFLRPVRQYLGKAHPAYDKILLVMDSVGLGIFTVMGVRTALLSVENCGAFLLIFVGVTTGVGGGVLRDVLASETPVIFRKMFYASASLLGAVTYILLYPRMTDLGSLLTGALVVFILRMLAAHYHWKLPRAEE